MKRKIIAWIKKYIFRVHSPTAKQYGLDFEYDFLKSESLKTIEFIGKPLARGITDALNFDEKSKKEGENK